MKKKIHPKYNNKAKIRCSCGNSFETGSTVDEIHTEICNKCHPFFTGTQKLVDTARRVEKFEERKAKTATASKTRKGKAAKKKIRVAKRKEKIVKVKTVKKKAPKEDNE